MDGLAASVLPTQDVFAELRRVDSSTARCHHGETFLEQSLQHLNKKSEVHLNEANYFTMSIVIGFPIEMN